MSGDRLFACIGALIILCFTGMVSHCTYTQAQCKQEAIRAGKLEPAQIRSLCSP